MSKNKAKKATDLWKVHPQTDAIHLGFDPALSVYSAKVPVYLTSTFVFPSAEAGERFFKLALGKVEPEEGEEQGLIYSRLNNPNGQILEERLASVEDAEAAAVMSSGMGAIATTILALLKPGDTVVYTNPVYGGTEHLFQHFLSKYNITCLPVDTGDIGKTESLCAQHKDSLAMIYIETPANPTNRMTDIEEMTKIARKFDGNDRRVRVAVDNTFMGPIHQSPLRWGADLVLYSATKLIGGHSDLIAGFAVGSKADVFEIKNWRMTIGTNSDAFSCWLMLRSMETLEIRLRAKADSARELAHFLAHHPKVSKVYYPSLLTPGDPQYDIYQKQCLSSGSMIAFEVEGGKEAAFRVLNAVHYCRLAVSLGGTESLIQHPRSMTHSETDKETADSAGITDGLVRLSVGVENVEDLKHDLETALAKV
jgi:methionine-gamma-lyase